MAQIAQSRQLTKSALATQKASEVFDQGIPARAAPAQKLAFSSQSLFSERCTDLQILARIVTPRTSQPSIAV